MLVFVWCSCRATRGPTGVSRVCVCGSAPLRARVSVCEHKGVCVCVCLFVYISAHRLGSKFGLHVSNAAHDVTRQQIALARNVFDDVIHDVRCVDKQSPTSPSVSPVSLHDAAEKHRPNGLLFRARALGLHKFRSVCSMPSASPPPPPRWAYY